MEQQTSPSTSSSKKPIAIVIAAVILIAGGIVAYASGVFKNNPAPATPVTNNPAPATPVTTTGKYSDGTYTTTQAYHSPGGNEQFGLSVTLANGVITGATFTPMPVSPVGKMKQAGFAAAFQAQVVGKNIDDVSIGVLAGASLTSAGFMAALQTIKAKAMVS